MDFIIDKHCRLSRHWKKSNNTKLVFKINKTFVYEDRRYYIVTIDPYFIRMNKPQKPKYFQNINKVKKQED